MNDSIKDWDDIKNDLGDHPKLLKEIFTRIIVNNNPKYSHCQHNIYNETFVHYSSISCFIKIYEKIFTINYDTILYWSILHSEKKFVEFFCQKINHKSIPIFNSISGTYDIIHNTDASVSYLHGAIFLYKTSKNCKKIIANEDQDLVTTITEYKEKPPLIVSEGASNDKYKKIKEVPYLKQSLQRLSNIQGNIVIYGSSISENDNHIWQCINENSNVKQVFVSTLDQPKEKSDVKKM